MRRAFSLLAILCLSLTLTAATASPSFDSSTHPKPRKVKRHKAVKH